MRFTLLIALILLQNLAVLEISGAEGDSIEFVDEKYPDFGHLLPPGEYDGRIFTLSQRYPMKEPMANKLPEFLNIDYADQWRAYLDEAQEYCFRENILGGDVEDDFDPVKEENPKWFHMPWQHYGPKGREGIHGLTKEAGVKPHQLAIGQTYEVGQMYAVGLYNEFGAYTIGRVWRDKHRPNKDVATFPNGTVVFKLLFTDVPTEQVPSLVNPLLWDAYVLEEHRATTRSVKKLALIQMDVMVRDDRAPYNWVFGTYLYNGKLNRDNKWQNLVPIGIQWGNDPDVNDGEGTEGEYTNPFPCATKINPNLKETRINSDANELPPTHLGWNGRLNGPADNYLSSCMSCHMTAQSPEISPSSPLFLSDKSAIPAVGSYGWMRWFANLPSEKAFDRNAVSVDFSLQMSMSLQNYYKWSDSGNKYRADQYRAAQKKHARPQVEYQPQR